MAYAENPLTPTSSNEPAPSGFSSEQGDCMRPFEQSCEVWSQQQGQWAYEIGRASCRERVYVLV